MTCIVGLRHNGKVFIGGDSLGSNNYTKTVRQDKKVFKLKGNPNAILGFTSSYRMGQLLMFAENLIPIEDDNRVDYEYIVTKFIPRVIELFDKNGYGKTDSGEKSAGHFLLAYRDKLYEIHEDYQVAEPIHEYSSCGCGEVAAKGSLFTSSKYGDGLFEPEDRIFMALQSATDITCGVEPPFYIVNTYDDTVLEYS